MCVAFKYESGTKIKEYIRISGYTNLYFYIVHICMYVCSIRTDLLQAQARCHRIGQERAVKVYRLITRNSYEREMFDRCVY